MRKHFVPFIVFLLLLSPLKAFCVPRQALSFFSGTGADSSFIEKNTVSLELIYDFTGSFLKFTGGSRFTSVSADFSFKGTIFKSFFKDSPVTATISSGTLFHTAFLNNEAFLQDSFLMADGEISVKPLFTTLGIMGGIGFNSTFVYQDDGTWTNELYPFLRAYIETNIMNRVTLGAGLSNSTFFIYDFWSPKAAFWTDVKLARRVSVSGSVLLRYTTNAANDNLQIEGIDLKMGVKYEL